MNVIEEVVTNDALETLKSEINAMFEQDEADDRVIIEKYETRMYRARDIGMKLIQAKDLVGHGNWQKWVYDNCTMRLSQAKVYMDLARNWDENVVMNAIKETTNVEKVLARCKAARMTPEQRQAAEAKAAKRAAKAAAEKAAEAPSEPSEPTIAGTPSEPPEPREAKEEAPEAPSEPAEPVFISSIGFNPDATSPEMMDNILGTISSIWKAPELSVVEGGWEPEKLFNEWCQDVSKCSEMLKTLVTVFEKIKQRDPNVVQADKVNGVVTELTKTVESFMERVYRQEEFLETERVDA